MDESVVKHLDQPIKTLRLSEAIRIGAKIRPQCTGAAFKDGASCAWGAAWEGSGRPYQEGMNYTEAWGVNNFGESVLLFRAKYGCGVACMNDGGESREKIADRLEAIGY